MSERIDVGDLVSCGLDPPPRVSKWAGRLGCVVDITSGAVLVAAIDQEKPSFGVFKEKELSIALARFSVLFPDEFRLLESEFRKIPRVDL